MKRSGARNAGITLVETISAILVLAIAATVALGAVGSALPQSVETQRPILAQELARDLLDEVLSKPFNDPVGADGETAPPSGPRIALDDVDDYNGYRDTPPVNPQGQALAGRGGFTRAVRVVPVSSTSLDGAAVNRGSARFLRVEVDAAFEGGVVKLAGLKAAAAGPGAVLPFPRSGLVYVDGSRNSGNSEHVVFRAVNKTGAPIPVDAVSVSWRKVGGGGDGDDDDDGHHGDDDDDGCSDENGENCGGGGGGDDDDDDGHHGGDDDALFFKEIKIDGTVLAHRVPLFAEGERIALSQTVTFNPNSPREVSVKHFRERQSGQGPAGHMREYVIEMTFFRGDRPYLVTVPTVDDDCDNDHHDHEDDDDDD